jgi:hypothetical protein
VKEQKIDLTGDTAGTYLTVLTDAGIILVSTGLVNVQTGRPVVEVTIEPNDEYAARTAPGGVWKTEIDDNQVMRRTDIRLIRQELLG